MNACAREPDLLCVLHMSAHSSQHIANWLTVALLADVPPKRCKTCVRTRTHTHTHTHLHLTTEDPVPPLYEVVGLLWALTVVSL